jgi:hypothetical protein
VNDFIVIKDAFVCGFDAWMDIWGDPWLSGSIFMISYGVTALLIFKAARQAAARERLYWRLCGSLFLFQVVNTNLDLHALIWTTGRCLSHAQGWYDQRKEIQIALLVGLALFVAIILFIVFIAFFRNIFRNILLTLGVAIAIGFTLVKGISYHGLADFYGRPVGPFHVADLIEYSGILLAFIAAVLRLRQLRIPGQSSTN